MSPTLPPRQPMYQTEYPMESVTEDTEQSDDYNMLFSLETKESK